MTRPLPLLHQLILHPLDLCPLAPGEHYEAARAWVEEKRRTGEAFIINGTYTAATAYISAMKESEQKEGVLRIKVELMDESAHTLWWPVAR